ncbi:unnamed protein product [Calypogeia fissa]
MGRKQHDFVWVHGAGHGAWRWAKLTAVLEKGGHRVTAINLASAGEKPTIAADDVETLEEYNWPLEDVMASIPNDDNEKVVIDSHSQGGLSVACMCELYPKKIAVGVYLGAMMIAPGLGVDELMAIIPEYLRHPENFIQKSKIEGGPVTRLEFPVESLRRDFYNKCSEEDVAFAAKRVRGFPASTNPFAQFSLIDERYGSVPKVYVVSKEDKVFSPAAVQKMLAANRDKVYEIGGDHSLFYAALEELDQVF